MRTLVVKMMYFDEDIQHRTSFTVGLMCPFDNEPEDIDFEWAVVDSEDLEPQYVQ